MRSHTRTLGLARSFAYAGMAGLLGLTGCTDDAITDDGDGVTDVTEVSDEAPAEIEHARGIHIGEVEINQGTRILIGNGPDWIDGPERSGYIIADRDTLMRVHYTVDDDWIPREIEARLTLTYPGGESAELTQPMLVEGDSQPYSLDGTFWFGLIADQGQAVAGTKYKLELWETAPGAGEEQAEGAWENPAAGANYIGFESRTMQLKVVMVPIDYTWNGIDRLAEVETYHDQLVDNLYEQNPATEVITMIRDSVEWSSQMSNLGALLPLMAQVRSQDNAPPNWYYHAFIDVNGLHVNSVLGISFLANDTKANATNRVSATVLWPNNPGSAADTFTHETGHAQGLEHVACPGRDAANPNPAYPYENGRIGNWGFGIRRFKIFDPFDAFDYMSYCSPSWVSDWTWNKTFERISTLTSWDFESPAPDDPQADATPSTLLMTAIYPDGTRDWWTLPGVIDPERIAGTDRMIFETNEGEVIERWSQVEYLSDGETLWMSTELPVELDALAQIVHLGPGGAKTITPSEIGLRHVVDAGVKPVF